MDYEKFKKAFYTEPIPSQNFFEFWSLFCFLQNFVQPKIIIEIGVFRGGTIKFWQSILSKDGVLIGVDNNERGKMESVKQLYQNDSRVKLLFGDSDSSKILFCVSSILSGNLKADILFIDGNHKSEIVFEDYKNYRSFVRPGGLVIFHDITNYSVKKIWDSMKGELVSAGGKREFVNDGFECFCEFIGRSEPCGIGVLISKEA